MTSIIILAAGTGSRMNLGYNKMNLEFNNTPLYRFSIKKFMELGYEDIILVCNSDIKCLDVRCVSGGKERMNSVYNGLKAAKGDYVMIHDGARPLVSKAKILEIEKALNDHDCVLLAKKVTDTIKIIDNGRIKTLDRNKLIAAETPQAFKKSLILDCMEHALKDDYIPTDDVSLIEKYTDNEIFVVYDDSPNMKLTTRADLEVAKVLLEKEAL